MFPTSMQFVLVVFMYFCWMDMEVWMVARSINTLVIFKNRTLFTDLLNNSYSTL